MAGTPMNSPDSPYSAKLGAHWQNRLFVVIDDVDDAGQSAADAVFGAALAADRHPGVLDDLLADVFVFKLKTGVSLCEFSQFLAAESNLRPRHHNGVAVFAHHAAVNRVVRDAGSPVEHVFQPRGIKAGAGAEDAPSWQPGQFRNLIGDDIAGVGDVDDDAVKAAGHHFWKKVGDLGNREIQFLEAVVVRRRENGDVANGIDDNVHVAEIAVIRYVNFHGVRAVGHRVTKVLAFADDLVVIRVDQIQLVDDALERKGIRAVGADVAQTDDGNFSLFNQNHTPSFLRENE